MPAELLTTKSGTTTQTSIGEYADIVLYPDVAPHNFGVIKNIKVAYETKFDYIVPFIIPFTIRPAIFLSKVQKCVNPVTWYRPPSRSVPSNLDVGHSLWLQIILVLHKWSKMGFAPRWKDNNGSFFCLNQYVLKSRAVH